MPRTRLLPLMAAILFVLAGASDAHAGQYTLSYDFSADLSGWSGYVEPGYNLCGHTAPVGCPDVSTNRIMARVGGAQAIWSQGRWEWTAPPGTVIVGGALAYRTRMRHAQFFARVKVRDATDWAGAPTLLAEQQTTTLTDHVVALPAGFRQVGVSLYSHPAVAGLITDAWDDWRRTTSPGRTGAPSRTDAAGAWPYRRTRVVPRSCLGCASAAAQSREIAIRTQAEEGAVKGPSAALHHSFLHPRTRRPSRWRLNRRAIHWLSGSSERR